MFPALLQTTLFRGTPGAAKETCATLSRENRARFPSPAAAGCRKASALLPELACPEEIPHSILNRLRCLH
jgi:hypothetical protein